MGDKRNLIETYTRHPSRHPFTNTRQGPLRLQMDMVRPKRAKTRESSSARPEVDDDYVPPTEVEEQPRESSGHLLQAGGARGSPVLTFYHKASPSLRDALGRTPLGPFLTIPRIQSDRRLVAALCERWFGETNTFHFPCCELAITPLDFVMLTGIPIVGEVIPPLSVISMDRAAGLMGGLAGDRSSR
ncbi:hypothetical protein HHK36_023376 [Tetracentron sinense]|uniref:Aminotransferase-like plant mobile domain-containing protein n=1 Tax=Tetracentron sinense TaxID=13715 RepID=A0A834YQ80_TETSI|nr:hypothetical protein HHK36_023376 [Tetracentron sinense]